MMLLQRLGNKATKLRFDHITQVVISKYTYPIDRLL